MGRGSQVSARFEVTTPCWVPTQNGEPQIAKSAMIKHALCIASLLLGLVSAKGAEPAHLVFMIGEDEYHTSETLPEFAEKELKPLGYRISLVQADPANPNEFPGLVSALSNADLLFLSVRRRTPVKEQLEAVRAHPQGSLAGIPTITYDIDGAKEGVIDGRTGFVHPPFDKKAFAGSISKLVEDAVLRKRLGEAGREFALARFDTKVMVNDLEKVYQSAPMAPL